jgi:hypothetical protein
MARIQEAFIKALLKEYQLEKITFSSLVELINQEAKREPSANGIGIFHRDECPFVYCPNPDLCQHNCINT